MFLVECLRTIGATGEDGGLCDEIVGGGTISSIMGGWKEEVSVVGGEDWWEKYSQSGEIEEGEWW